MAQQIRETKLFVSGHQNHSIHRTVMTSTKLKRPIIKSQIDAALKIYEQASQWQSKNEVLRTLKAIDPELRDIYMTRVKAMALINLYGAGLPWKDVNQVAQNIEEIRDQIDDIKRLLSQQDEVPKSAFVNDFLRKIVQGLKKEQMVFASKFGHFFIDDRFPILDSFAEIMVEFHSGLQHWENAKINAGKESRYKVFWENFIQLKTKELSGFTNRNMDTYLWIAGQYKQSKEEEIKGAKEGKEKIDPEREEIEGILANNIELCEKLFPYDLAIKEKGKRAYWT
jgi:hypothetical protein